MLRCFSEPRQNRILFEAFDSRQGTDAIPFGEQGQGLENFVLGCPLAVEDRPGCCGKGLLAGLAPKALHTLSGLAELLNVPLPLTVLKLSIVRTSFVWTEIAGFRKLFHLSPSEWSALIIHYLPATLKRETIQKLEYSYDAMGNVMTITDYNAGGTQTQRFSYDSLDRLVSASTLGISAGCILMPVAPGIYLSLAGDTLQMAYDYLRSMGVLSGWSLQVQW
jgi:YD repeat-containing protein